MMCRVQTDDASDRHEQMSQTPLGVGREAGMPKKVRTAMNV